MRCKRIDSNNYHCGKYTASIVRNERTNKVLLKIVDDNWDIVHDSTHKSRKAAVLYLKKIRRV